MFSSGAPPYDSEVTEHIMDVIETFRMVVTGRKEEMFAMITNFRRIKHHNLHDLPPTPSLALPQDCVE